MLKQIVLFSVLILANAHVRSQSHQGLKVMAIQGEELFEIYLSEDTTKIFENWERLSFLKLTLFSVL